jgi:hypothetical protein
MLLIETRPRDAWAEYKVKDEIIFYAKHSSSMRSLKRDGDSARNYSFGADHFRRIQGTSNGSDVYMALVCGQMNLKEVRSMQACVIHPREVYKLLELNTLNSQTVGITLLPGTRRSLRVRGSLRGSLGN